MPKFHARPVKCAFLHIPAFMTPAWHARLLPSNGYLEFSAAGPSSFRVSSVTGARKSCYCTLQLQMTDNGCISNVFPVTTHYVHVCVSACTC